MDIFAIIIVIGIAISIYVVTKLRKVVPTNEVHIVQRWSKSVPYWKSLQWWNVYLAWAPWVPIFWVAVQKLPLSIFSLQLTGYKAYDNWKVPFQVDITAFFEIKDPVLAAEKIFTISELEEQLNETVKWVVRKILASIDVVDIMESRSDIKEEFYKEVFSAVKAWWVDLKNVEFMDIKDAEGSQVITNIMMKKRSLIEAESEIEVAENQKNAIIEKENKESEARAKAAEAKSRADIIESDARRLADLKKIENDKITQNQDIEKDRILSIQKEVSKQNFYEAEKETKIKMLAVKQVEDEKNAEIEKNIEIIRAEKQKQKAIIEAEWSKIQVELQAEAEKNKIEFIWLAKAKELDYIWTAEAKNKAQMADSLNAFTSDSLNFMIKQLDIHLAEVVDLEKAKALSNADIKVISTGVNGWEWVKSFMDLFSANCWANIGAMVEAAKNTMWEEKVDELLSKVWFWKNEWKKSINIGSRNNTKKQEVSKLSEEK